jgi:PAS domain S-box-containing protein
MHSIFLIPLGALIFNNFTWGYVLAQRRKKTVNQAYLILSISVSCWLTQNLILWLPVDKFWNDVLIFLNPIFWLPIGFLYLNFSYAYLSRKRDFIYFLSLFLTSWTIVISLATSLMGRGYEIKVWGPLPLAGVLYYPSVLFDLLLPCVYSLFLLYRCFRSIDDINQKNQLLLIILGTWLGLLVGTFTDIILSHTFHLTNVIPLGSTGGAILSIFVFFAMTRYRFLTIDIEDIASDLFANVQDGIILLKNEDSVIQMNKTAQQLFNLESEDLLESKIATYIENYHFQENYSDFETQLLANGNQQPKRVSLSQSMVKLANREVGKILIIRDITAYHQAMIDLRKHRNQLGELVKERTAELTEMNKQLLKNIIERKQTEVQLRQQEKLLQTAVAGLRESEARYRTLAENTFDLICEASQDGVLMYVSPNCREVLGYDPEELIGKNGGQYLHPDELEHISGDFDRVISSFETFQNTHRCRHKKGDWLWFESAGKPYRAPDDSIRLIFVLRDITHRRKIEEEMIKANKLESIGILAGGLAHDFNNILSILWGNITMAKIHAGPDSKVDQRLIKAEQALIRARELTQQLLIFAKGVEPIKRVTSIADLISESLHLALRGSSIGYKFSPEDDLWLVEVDEGQMNQVFNNLLINAEQAMPDGGNIKINAQNMIVSEDDGLPLSDGKYVKLSFTDQGEGIPEDNLRKVFDPYFTTKPKGTGLGLATAYSIIKKHHGYISIESQEGIGTTVNLYIPASETRPLPKKIIKPSHFKAQGRVLVMDDERELAEVLAKMLSQIGYEVQTAGDGVEAIELFKQAQHIEEPFSLVIMDLVIQGGMGGKETIKYFLQINPNIKVIVSSGYSKDPVMANYKKYGFRGVLTKPYTLAELIEVLEMCSNNEYP